MLKELLQAEKNKRKKSNKYKSKAINKMAIRTYISIITLNVNGVNAPTKRYKLAELIHKQDTYICCLQETHIQIESERMEENIPCKQKLKESWSSNTHIRQNRL